MNRLLGLHKRPTAVFAAADTVAYGAMKAVREAGLTVPDDISLVGFDDDYLSRYTSPPLTSVSVPASGLGAAAADILIRILMEKELPSGKRIILPTQLTKRSSCAPR